MTNEIIALADQFYQAGATIVEEFKRPFANQAAPPLVYHYTDDSGLRGILESGKIWLNDIFNLNDPTELRHGIERAIELIKAMSEAGAPEFKMFAKKFEFIKDGGIEKSAHYFVACFSMNGDELGQWRAYANDGKGFALGFDANALEQGFATPGSPLTERNSTFPVTYNDQQLRTIQERVIGELPPYLSVPRGKTLTEAVINGYMQHLLVRLSVLIFQIALYFKHKAYVNEAECRFLNIQRGDQPAEGVKFRKQTHGLVRYIEYDWRTIARGCLKQIIVGPSADREKVKAFLRNCFEAFGYDDGEIEIRQSAIPYRSARL